MASSQTKTRRRGEHDDTPAPPRSSVREAASPTAPGGEPGGGRVARGGGLTERGGERLTRALLAKSLAEALFLVALLVLFSYSYFNPRFRGSLDGADERTVEGWAVDESAPGRQVEVQLFIDGHFVAQRRADRPRPDVLAAGRAARAEHGFRFETPPLPPRAAEYEARVYALHAPAADPARRTLRQVGDPARFRVAASGRNERTPETWWELPPAP